MKALIASIAPQLIEGIGAVFAAIVTMACYRLSGYIKAHTKNARVQGILLRLNDATFTAVSALEQTVVATAKAQTASGMLTRSAASAVKAAALENIKTHLGPQGLGELKAILGVQDVDLDAFIAARIESSVLTMPVAIDHVAAPLAVPMVQAPHVSEPGSVTVNISATEAATPVLPIKRDPSKGAAVPGVLLVIALAAVTAFGVLALDRYAHAADASPQLGFSSQHWSFQPASALAYQLNLKTGDANRAAALVGFSGVYDGWVVPVGGAVLCGVGAATSGPNAIQCNLGLLVSNFGAVLVGVQEYKDPNGGGAVYQGLLGIAGTLNFSGSPSYLKAAVKP
jgi:hypothetical protein